MAVPYKQPPWSERYPKLVNILDDEPAAPKGNIVRRNICIGGQWLNIEDKAKPYVRIEDNLTGDEAESVFVDAIKGDFRFRSKTAASKIGFKPIPFERIGLYRDKWRTKLPPVPM